MKQLDYVGFSGLSWHGDFMMACQQENLQVYLPKLSCEINLRGRRFVGGIGINLRMGNAAGSTLLGLAACLGICK